MLHLCFLIANALVRIIVAEIVAHGIICIIRSLVSGPIIVGGVEKHTRFTGFFHAFFNKSSKGNVPSMTFHFNYDGLNVCHFKTLHVFRPDAEPFLRPKEVGAQRDSVEHLFLL